MLINQVCYNYSVFCKMQFFFFDAFKKLTKFVQSKKQNKNDRKKKLPERTPSRIMLNIICRISCDID